MNLRRLNSHGIEQFEAYLGALREDGATPVPGELLDDPRFTEPMEPPRQIERVSFATKFEAGQFLREALKDLPTAVLRSDVGLWAWLAVCFFDELCPADGNGRRRPKENVKYIPRAGDHRLGLDKHQLFFPWKMVSLHGDATRCFLSDAPGADSRAQREWTGYYLNLSTPLVELAAGLYENKDTGSLKRGATSTNRPGNLRRFMQIAKQLEVTYDIPGMAVNQIRTLLPRSEFDRSES